MAQPEATSAGLVARSLDHYGGLVREAIEGYLPSREPAYHYELVRDYPRRGGRMLRPALCMAVAQALGAPAAAALPTAVAIELFHNAVLVHDDIEDASTHRRGRPTLHETHGIPMAINVGDALALLALRPLLDNRDVIGSEPAFEIIREMERMGQETVEGQATELGWRRERTLAIGEEAYLQMVLKKTCWYTIIFPCRAGAIVALRSSLATAAFVRFGFFLGASFQIQDDLLNLCGDPERYGKELGGDILEAKRTLPFVHLRNALPSQERAELDRIFTRERLEIRQAEADWVLARMAEYGSLDHARRIAHGLSGAARHEFEVAFAGVQPSEHLRFIGALPEWVLSRS